MATQENPNPAPVEEHGEEEPIANPETREGDEMRILVIGFTIGMSIAGIFLVYIVLAAAGLLK